MSFISGLGVRIWTYLAAIGAALLVAWRVIAGIQRAERDRIKAAAAEQARRQRDTRDEIDRAVAREPDPMQRLRDDWSKPG